MALNLTGIVEIDLHGMNTSEANAAIDDALRKATDSVYRIRCIHGFNRGTARNLGQPYKVRFLINEKLQQLAIVPAKPEDEDGVDFSFEE